MSVISRATRGSSAAAMGGLYLVDFMLRARQDQLNAIETVIYSELQERSMLMDDSTLRELIAAVSISNLETISESEAGAALVKRTLGSNSPGVVARGELKTLLNAGPLSEVAPSLAYSGLVVNASFVGDLIDWVGETKDDLDTLKEAAEAGKDLTEAVKDGTENVKDTFGNLKGLLDKAVTVFEGGEGGETISGAPTEYPDFGKPVPNEWIALTLNQPGYRIAIDQIICHEEESWGSNDNIAWACRSLTVLDNGALIANLASSTSMKEMNGHEKLSNTLYKAQHPGPPTFSGTPRPHTHILSPDEAYLVSVAPGHTGIPKVDYRASDIKVRLIDVDAGDWEKISKAAAAAISIYRGFNKSNPIPVAQLGDLAAAVGVFLSQLVKIADDDDELLVADGIQIYKSDIDGAPELGPTSISTISGVPWVREARHDQLRDVSSVRAGLVIHGIRNDQKQDEDHGHWFLGDEALRKAFGADPWDGVMNEAGSWWYEIRLRYELTEPSP